MTGGYGLPKLRLGNTRQSGHSHYMSFLFNTLKAKTHQVGNELYVKSEDYDRLVLDMCMTQAIVESLVLAGVGMGGHLKNTEDANKSYQYFESVCQKYKKQFQSGFGRLKND